MKIQTDNTLDPDLFMSYERSFSGSSIIPAILEIIKKPNAKICDIGGATGIILNHIILKTPFKVNCYILDMFKEYKKNIANKEINFILGSILNNKLKDNSFDFVIFRDVLHHLIVGGREDILINQQKALQEMTRITKPGGYIIFEEEVNNSQLSSKIIYYLSYLANKLHFGATGINLGKVVVSFMSEKEINKILQTSPYPLKIIKYQFIPLRFSFLWRSTLLMNNFGRVFYIIKKTVK